MTKTTGARRTYSTKTPAEREAELDQLKDMLTKGVAGITDSDQWKAYLRVAAKFHSYSFGNIILAMIQLQQRGFPNPPTHMAAYARWKDFGRHVRKGEAGLKIFAPIIVKLKPGDDGYDPNKENSRLVGFRVTRTWDIQQTDGEPLPDPPFITYPKGEIPAGMWDAALNVVKETGFSFGFGITGNADGFTQFLDRSIVVSGRLKGNDARSTMVLLHEIAHVKLHDPKDYPDYHTHRGVAETEAESVAFIVGTYFGIDTGTEAFRYVANWAPDSETINKVGARIIKTSRELIAAIEPLVTPPATADAETAQPVLF